MNLQEVLPLEEAAAAHERAEGGHTRGKIVLRVDAGPGKENGR